MGKESLREIPLRVPELLGPCVLKILRDKGVHNVRLRACIKHLLLKLSQFGRGGKVRPDVRIEGRQKSDELPADTLDNVRVSRWGADGVRRRDTGQLLLLLPLLLLVLLPLLRPLPRW